MERVVKSNSADFTAKAGREFAAGLNPGTITGLFGNLGSGKTQFVKGVCEYFGVEEVVNSPTFIIKNEHVGIDPVSGNEIKIFHFDLFRISVINELTELGFSELYSGNSVTLIEWAELADEYFRGNINRIYFEYGEKENERIIKFS
ncbi:MAG: tRNA (adenosine(37)-N6)-threonylcarbamoyltransferase complex ATPase subunit type 1 TsaE [Ignavibacteria bacterium]|nr:tRNA (adenosine(37)-N6)-threonylcarbamoyltransferase complex ATPase subunit type 1 TsaE [Ignavibacteria bacterium]